MSEPRRTLRWAVLGVLLLCAIIVPFVIWEDALTELSHRWLDSETNRMIVAVLAAVLLALDLVLPIPSSFVSAGVVAAIGPVLGAVAIWTGMSVGALAGYALGRTGGTPLVERFVGRSELERAERLMARFGSAVLVVCRGVPVLAEASVVVAGAAKMRFSTFAWVTGSANLGLAAAYALLSSAGWGGAAAVITPFVLGIAVPGICIFIAKRLERPSAEP
ncbi:MAG TPA: VTT domain-containing protein [Polyangiaceae bacterium]